jgi:hypothetical protein
MMLRFPHFRCNLICEEELVRRRRMIAPQTMKEEEDHDEMIHLTKDPLETQNQRGFSPDAMAPGRYREPSRFSECIKIGEVVLQKSP